MASTSTYELCSQSLGPNLSTDERQVHDQHGIAFHALGAYLFSFSFVVEAGMQYACTLHWPQLLLYIIHTPCRQDQLIQCLASSLDQTNSGVNTFFLIYAASLVFYMQAGFAMLCAGSVRIKNLQNTMLKNLLDACGAALGFYTIGYAFAWGGSREDNTGTTFIGLDNFFLMGVEQKAFWLFQFAFAATSATIVAGTLAERCQMLAYLLYSTALTGFIYPVVVHRWVVSLLWNCCCWLYIIYTSLLIFSNHPNCLFISLITCGSLWTNTGFLSSYNANPLLGVGVLDFAGCLVVHTTGGVTALIAAYILGPRKGRFYYDGEGKRQANDIPGHSIALKVCIKNIWCAFDFLLCKQPKTIICNSNLCIIGFGGPRSLVRLVRISFMCICASFCCNVDQ